MGCPQWDQPRGVAVIRRDEERDGQNEQKGRKAVGRAWVWISGGRDALCVAETSREPREVRF